MPRFFRISLQYQGYAEKRHANNIVMPKTKAMPFIPKIIKPCRIQSRQPVLKKARVIRNAQKGKETSLILDLNILSKMHEVETKKVSFANSGLKALVNFLNSTPALYITPGFAIQEVDNNLSVKIIESFNSFLEKFCPNYIDHPNSLKDISAAERKPQEFQKLPLSERYLNSIAYLGVLKIQTILKKESNLNSIEKFSSYIDYMVSNANVVGAIEAEVAKYTFIDSSTVKDIKFRKFCQKIKHNFKKSGNTNQKLLQRCMNSARDIMYYRLTAHMSNEIIDDKRQDTWLVTGDEGLANLSESIHFVPGIDNSDSKYFTVVRHREQKKNPYWDYCDNLCSATINGRQLLNIALKKKGVSVSAYNRLLECIYEAEQDLSVSFMA